MRIMGIWVFGGFIVFFLVFFVVLCVLVLLLSILVCLLMEVSLFFVGEIVIIGEDLVILWLFVFYDGVVLISECDIVWIFEGMDVGLCEVVWISDVEVWGEGGLLGIVVYDDLFYVYFMGDDGNSVWCFLFFGELGVFEFGVGQMIFFGIFVGMNYNGGCIVFGFDGMFYVVIGDVGDWESVQDLMLLGGKIFWFMFCGVILMDNFFEVFVVFSYGYCNLQGFVWDDEGMMYVSEFGQDIWDELNWIEFGVNYGWFEVEGSVNWVGFVDFVQQWVFFVVSLSGIVIQGGSFFFVNF